MSRRRLGRFAAAFLVLLVLAFAGFAAAVVPGSAASSSAGIGVYRGAASPGEVSAFGSWLGRSPTYALDFFAGDTWSQIESPDWWLNAWNGTPYTVEFSVPIIPSSGGTLQEGASGAYNSHFQKLAQTLVAHGRGNAILRLGWEFNGSWYHWYAGNDPAAFAAYWRQIVTTMRAVAPGLRFDWCPTLGVNGMSKTGVEAAYPGDAYVDYVGTDVYDQAWGPNNTTVPDPAVRWDGYVTQQNGLNWVASFSSQHGKPITIPEWGLSIRSDGHGGGDNAFFVQHMHDWITTNNVAYQMYFEFDAPDGQHRLMLSQFPIGSAAYKQLFAGAATTLSTSSSSSSTTAPSTTTAPGATTAPATTTTTPPPPATTTTTTPPTTTTTTPPPTTTTTGTTTTVPPASTTTTAPPPTTTTSPSTATTTPTSGKKCRGRKCGPIALRLAQTSGASGVGAVAAQRAACARTRIVWSPPTWFWKWVRWRLGRAEFKGHAGAAAYRPRAVPQHVSRRAWSALGRFTHGQPVAVRVCTSSP
jgi:Glycosyl hydrolase family 26